LPIWGRPWNKRQGETCHGYRCRVEHSEPYHKAHNNLGNALYRVGQVSEAIEHYQQAVQIQPECAVAYVNLAAVLAQTGRFDEAIEHCQCALRLAQAAGNRALAEQVETRLRTYRGGNPIGR
jgi:tetratricopeptide (TPR) repeat protein